MTRDEIETMPAGREMDAMIYKILFPDEQIPDVISPSWQDAYGFEDTNYSTDIAAAWKVFSRLGKEWSIKQHIDTYVCVDEKNWNSGILVEAETAPLAICRAALLVALK